MKPIEIQKMLSGELYLASDPVLASMRKRARKITRQLNQTTEDQLDLRVMLLSELFGSLGANAFVESPFYCDYGANIHAGKNLFMNFNCVILDCAEVQIGDDVLMGPNVQLYTASHPLEANQRAAGPELAKPIRIGNKVWIGGGVIVCPGVTIGDNTTIGAGSVVTKDIPANVFAAGNPCRVIRQIDETTRPAETTLRSPEQTS